MVELSLSPSRGKHGAPQLNLWLLSCHLRIAQADKRPQQAAIIQTAARLLSGADDETKESLMRLIGATPLERQRVLNLTESLFLAR
jgi:hypothetical protein